MINRMKIFVTGAAGFIGSHTVERLVKCGHYVVGADSLVSGSLNNLGEIIDHPMFEFENLDLADEGVASAALMRHAPDAVLHLAALVNVQKSLEEPDFNFRQNILMPYYLMEAVREHLVCRVVMASSAAVYGDVNKLPIDEGLSRVPTSPYGVSKSYAEDLLRSYCKCYGIDGIALRYFNVYGSRQNGSSPYSGVISVFNDRMSRGRKVTIDGDGKQTRDFVYVKDVARANELALTADCSGFHAANVSRGEQVTLLQLYELFQELHEHCYAPCFGEPRKGDIRESCGDTSKAKALLGFEAKYNLRAGLTDWMGGLLK